MPYKNPDHIPQLQNPHGTKLDVNVTFDADGKLHIYYIRFEDDTHERFVYKINTTRLYQSTFRIETYDCTYVARNCVHHLAVVFNASEHKWFLGSFN